MSEEKPFVKPPLCAKGSWRSQTVKGRRLSSTVPGDLVAVAAVGAEGAATAAQVEPAPADPTSPKGEGFVKPPLMLQGSWKGNSAKSQSFKRSSSGSGKANDDVARALSAVAISEGAAMPDGDTSVVTRPPLKLQGSWKPDSAKSQSFKRSASGKDAVGDAMAKAREMIEQEEAEKLADPEAWAAKEAAKAAKPFVKPPLQGPADAVKGSWRSQSVKGRRLSSTVPPDIFRLASDAPPGTAEAKAAV